MTWAIEYRYENAGIDIINNLTNGTILARDTGTATLGSNNTVAQAAWFVNAGGGDLHLASSVGGVVNAGQAVSGLVDDFDAATRPYGGAYDIGADEYGSAPGTKIINTSMINLLLKD